jgi:hypothetical protein
MREGVVEYRFERSCDVVVAGAGVAGAAAAIQCARSGLDVVLLEKSFVPGGLATAGFVNVFLPLCDGHGSKIVSGIAEEFIRCCVSSGPGAIPAGWDDGSGLNPACRYMAEFSPAVFALALDASLVASGVDVWFDTVVRGAELADGDIRALEVFNKSGDGLLFGKRFVDATGDADVAFFSGCPTVEGSSHLSVWALQASMDRAGSAVEFDDSGMLLDILRLGADDSGRGVEGGAPVFLGIDGGTVSSAALESRRLLREHYGNLGPRESRRCFPLALPTIAQLRTTRKIDGLATIDASRNRFDAVGRVPDWRERGVVWEIPLGSLIPRGVGNLLVAGRCVSAEPGAAWDAVRSIPASAFTGQAAGVAAALSLETGGSLGTLSPESVVEGLSSA